jgi:hypothetical protein
MGDARRVKCQNCGARKEDVGELSWAGYCVPCSHTLMAEAADAMKYFRGPKFDKWRRNMILSVGGILPDNLEEGEQDGRITEHSQTG